jgi:MoaA/NifB/PqqE/SkfB family radical SAM enzyme
LNKFENHSNYNCTVITDNNEKFNVFADWMHNEKLDQWQGWQCDAGRTRLYISKHGDVYSGACRNDFLGNVFNGSFKINKQPTECKRSRCTSCTDDLMVAKQKPSI